VTTSFASSPRKSLINQLYCPRHFAVPDCIAGWARQWAQIHIQVKLQIECVDSQHIEINCDNNWNCQVLTTQIERNSQPRFAAMTQIFPGTIWTMDCLFCVSFALESHTLVLSDREGPRVTSKSAYLITEMPSPLSLRSCHAGQECSKTPKAF
jgi:hypothetical protein